MVMTKGHYQCLECKAEGIETVYMYPTALGTHRKSKHGIPGATNKYYEKHKEKVKAGRAKLMPPTISDLVQAHKDTPLQCFYCERRFGRINSRTKHIHEDHPGLDAHTPQINLRRGTDNAETEEDKGTREYAIRCAGYLEGLCHGMASAKGYPPEEFTAGVARYLTAFTVR